MPFQLPRPRPRPRPRFPSLTPLPSDSDSDSIPHHSPPPSPHFHLPRPLRRPTTPPRPNSPHPRNHPITDDDDLRHTDIDSPDDDPDPDHDDHDDHDIPGPIDPLFVNQHLHHPAPFNVALVPDHMLADDPYTQDVVEDAIMRSVQTRGVHQHLDFEQRFATTLPHSLSLATLAALYRDHRAQDAVRLLQYRSHLVIPNSLLLDTQDDHRVLATMDGHFIDYSLCLGSRLGLDALLPSLAVALDHTWHIQLSFSRLFKLWPNTTSKLPFSTTGRMLHIGTRQQEEIWLALVPNTVLEPPHHLDADADAPPDQHHHPDPVDIRLADDFTPLDAPTTALLTTHAYMITLFFAHVLSTIRFDDIHLANSYPDDLTKESVSRETDLLGRLEENRRVLELTLPQLRLLHAQLRASWPAWVQRAPDSWKTDGFLNNNSPVALTVRYGQNQPIYSPSDERLRASIRHSWERDHDLTHVRSLSFSIAHHLVFKEVDQWTCLSGDILHRAHPGPLYDLPESDPDRVEVDLRRIRGGHDVPVYDTDGYRVRRRVPTRGRSTTSGALVDLTKVHDLFSPDERGKKTYHAYPLAFTKRFGNVQSSTTLRPYDPVIDKINRELTPPANANANDDDDDDADADASDAGGEEERRGDRGDRRRRLRPRRPRGAPVVRGTHSQLYNAISHRVRDQARFHYVQLGLVTSVLCGSTATTEHGKRRFASRKAFCRNGLPHERHANALRGDDQPQALRIEQTFTVDVYRLRRRHRNGMTIYDEVVSQICKSLAHPTVIDPIKRCLQPFKPQVIPNLMNWMTYPLTSVIDMIWKEHLPELESGKKPDPYHVEFVAILERALNYAHTGSAKVLSKAVMQPHYLALGAIHDGLPCLNPLLISFHDLLKPKPQLHIATQYWARNDSRDRRPLLASKRVQELTYGKSHMQQSEARFVIVDAVTHPDTCTSNDDRVEKKKDLSSNKLYQHVFEVAFKIYIEDVKEFVKNAVQKELEPLSRSRDFAVKQSARERRVLLKTWMAARYPLGYEAHEIAQLIAVLAPWQRNDPAQPRNRDDMAPLALPAPPGGGWSRSQFVDAVLKGASKRRAPPFIQHGMFKHTISEAIDLVGDLVRTQRPLWTHDPDQAKDLMKAIMVKAVQELKINHVPWVEVADGPRARGRPSTHITHTVWLPLGEAEPKRLATTNRVLLDVGRAKEAKLLESCDQIALRDAQTIWSATRHRLTNYHKVLHKQCLPSEWAYKNASIQPKDTLSKDVYTWLPETYDPINKPLHALAMVISLVFSGMLPMCFPQTNFSAEGVTSMPRLADMLANMPWVSREKKGATIPGPFITMVTAFIIALMDPESPFHICQDPSLKRIFVSKHTSKGINVMNVLLRFRLARPLTTKISKGSQWDHDVAPISDDEIRQKWERVKRHFVEKKEYGSFDAVVELAGEHTAHHLLKEQWVNTRGPVNTIARNDPIAMRDRELDDMIQVDRWSQGSDGVGDDPI
ncbi:hypothetical protein EV363DRAFT_1302449 [Boletus edulis]|nr:hypothetical protein EV363DRAFT_1302449 [Boletus edulis]